MFPEGNTGNGRALCAFKLGAFLPGKPVQPYVIKYSNPTLDVSW
jgi:lysophosphatidylcholine acyltransferase/lyso-PAF acetyltransferase